jgi:hypothetical protein
VRQIIYGIVNPTAGSFNVDFEIGTAITVEGIAFAISYLGGLTTSVAAAAIYLDEQINNAASQTVPMNDAVGGVAGRTAVAAATFLGGDGDPASETASGGQFASPMFNSATGTSTTADRSYWVADQINWTPAAVTVDWTGTASDECVGRDLGAVWRRSGGIGDHGRADAIRGCRSRRARGKHPRRARSSLGYRRRRSRGRGGAQRHRSDRCWGRECRVGICPAGRDADQPGRCAGRRNG